jgi:hypothetical protein
MFKLGLFKVHWKVARSVTVADEERVGVTWLSSTTTTPATQAVSLAMSRLKMHCESGQSGEEVENKCAVAVNEIAIKSA